MVLFWQGDRRRLCQALDWSLYSVKGERIYLGSEEDLVGYLRARPDAEFHLRSYRLREDMDPHREIALPEKNHPGSGMNRRDRWVPDNSTTVWVRFPPRR